MDRYEVLGVEREFRTPLINPDTGAPSRTFEMAGKIDAIVRERATGRTLIVEHKTSGEDITPGSVYWRKLRMDSQVSIYFAGAKALGYDVRAASTTCSGSPSSGPCRPTRKRDTPETPEEFRTRLIDAIAAADAYFVRAEVARTEADLREADADRWALAIALRDAQRTQVFPRNPDACSNYGRICGFFPICSGDGSIDDPAAFERVENPHPELEHEDARRQRRKEASRHSRYHKAERGGPIPSRSCTESRASARAPSPPSRPRRRSSTWSAARGS
jgi:hypothetical protein